MSYLPSRRGRWPAPILALSLLFVLPGAVAAHAELVDAAPAADATVEGTPTEVIATFTEPLLDGSSLVLRDADGQVAEGGPDPADPTRMVIVPPDLAPGTYEVRWTAATEDRHLERGRYGFTVVAAPQPSPSPTPSPTPAEASPATPPPTASPDVASPSPAPTGGDEEPAAAGTDVLLPIVAALVVLAVLGAILLSRRRPAS